jgi:hypothetical protein
VISSHEHDFAPSGCPFLEKLNHGSDDGWLRLGDMVKVSQLQDVVVGVGCSRFSQLLERVKQALVAARFRHLSPDTEVV